MIRITDKSLCCGCGSCAQRCPQHCITMESDEQGFLYPRVDDKQCVDCGLCERVCPIINHREARQPLAVYAAINPDEEIRLKSSSGGIFSMLAEQTINRGGVVFGAKFDANWNVIHDYTETIEGIAAFRGSKYVQSLIGDNYRKAEEFLKQGKVVLFTGTPCQIAGLKHFLGIDYENLLTLEVVCHGVPSSLVWKDYLKSVLCNLQSALNKPNIFISFRDKSKGWKDFCLNISLYEVGDRGEQSKVELLKESHRMNLFMQLFLNNFCLRPSCYSCPLKCGKSHSDCTIGDFWGIDKASPLFDNKGTSLLIVYSNKAQKCIASDHLIITKATYQQALAGNPMLEESVSEPEQTGLFWSIFNSKGISATSSILDSPSHPLFRRLAFASVGRLKRVLFRLLLK